MEPSKKKHLLLIVVLVLIVAAIAAFVITRKVDLLALLEDLLFNPVAYLPLLFLYSVLVAIILPIPIEFALIPPLVLGDYVFFAEAILVMALGKAVGAWAVFYLGLKIEDEIQKWSKRFKIAEKFVEWCTAFVRKTSYVGLFILLSIPLMSDTVVLYLYSLFNEEGKVLNMKLFGLVNFFAALTRATIFLIFWLVFKIILGW